MSDTLAVGIATPAAPPWSPADFADAFLNLLPNGPIWPRDPGAVLVRVATGLAPTYAALSARAAQLLQEAPAGQLTELLPDWEATLGLPDPCSGAAPGLATRRNNVRAAIAARGGQSVPYFVAVAAALGRSIAVQEFVPFRFGRPFGRPLASSRWAHAWRVTVATAAVRRFRFGTEFGQPFQSWGDAALECTLRRLAPAHTALSFSYLGPTYGAPLGQFLLGRDALG